MDIRDIWAFKKSTDIEDVDFCLWAKKGYLAIQVQDCVSDEDLIHEILPFQEECDRYDNPAIIYRYNEPSLGRILVISTKHHEFGFYARSALISLFTVRYRPFCVVLPMTKGRAYLSVYEEEGGIERSLSEQLCLDIATTLSY